MIAGAFAALVIIAGIAGGRSSPRGTSSSAARAAGTGGAGTTAPSNSTPGPSSTSQAAPATTSPNPAPAASPAGLRYGPGPQATYTVQPQPAPGSCHYRSQGGDPLPDPGCTPGVLNPQVTQATIGSTICRSGYTSSIRPPESITEPEKQGSAAAYGYTGPFSTGEYDHLVPLELGGDPNDAGNLWVEPNDNPNATSTANSKDVLENRLNDLVCSGQLPLAAAQEAIATDWATAYARYVGT